MEDLKGMAIFARVVEAGNLSAVARHLNISKSLVSKHVTHLEKSVGARLLNRTTRSMSVTDAGAVFYEYCARIVEELEAAKREVTQLQSKPRGLLKISVPAAFGPLHIVPALPQFLSLYPEVEIDMAITDRFVDLAKEGHDVVIRVVEQPTEHLVARRLARARLRICATPQYFARNGIPRVPADLERHNCLRYTSPGVQEPWCLKGPEGNIPVHASGNLTVDSGEAMLRAVLCGVGIALLPTFTIGQDLEAGRLQSVLSDYIPPERSVYAMYLPNRHLSPKVRAFIDYLLRWFSSQSHRDHLMMRPDSTLGHTEATATRTAALRLA